MIKLDFNKCGFNNLEYCIPVNEYVEYLSKNDLGSCFTNVNNACKCDNTEFDLYKFYFAISEELKNKSFFYSNESEMIEEWSDDDDTYDFIEILLYYCSECGYWCVDYNDISHYR